jgi:hypothetical protein
MRTANHPSLIANFSAWRWRQHQAHEKRYCAGRAERTRTHETEMEAVEHKPDAA